MPNREAQVGREGVPYIVTVCTNCGFLSQHALGGLGFQVHFPNHARTTRSLTRDAKRTGQDLPVQAAITIDTGMNERIVQRVDANVSQEIIVTHSGQGTPSARDAIQKIELRDAWKAPLGILVTLLVVRPAFNSLQDFLWIPKNVCKPFCCFALLCPWSGWLLP